VIPYVRLPTDGDVTTSEPAAAENSPNHGRVLSPPDASQTPVADFQVSVTGVSTATVVALAERVVGVVNVIGTSCAVRKMFAPLPHDKVNR
jgi:hypothetical protein